MKFLTKSIIITSALLLVSLLSSACQENLPTSNMQNDPGETTNIALHKDGYPMIASKTIVYNDRNGYYMGGNMRMSDRSTFHVNDNSTTPPDYITWGNDFDITWEIDFINNELVFTFGPHGTAFYPSAEVWLDFSILGTENVNLYYLMDDGTRELQQPVELKGQRLLLYIDHFSRYAIGTE